MKKVTLVLSVLLVLLLAACGGGGSESEAQVEEASSTVEEVTEETQEEESPPTEAPEEEPTAEEAPAEETTEEEVTEEEAPTEETAAEESAEAGGFGDRPMEGTDPDTGLEINPEQVFPGDTYIVRGTIISMNLTPTTSPEFLIEAPSGRRFRLRTQDLAETYYEDGAQLKAFEYQLGLLAQATASLAADAGPADLATSADLTLVYGGEK